MKNILSIIILGLLIQSCSSTKRVISSNLDTYFENIKQDKNKLKAFFKAMPKGGDIHHHASGTPYAEEYIKNALNDSCYINTTTYQLYFDKKDALYQKDSSAVLINTLLSQMPNEKDSIINNWSTRNYKERNKDGHDLFFSTFTKFKPAFVGHESELLSEICNRATSDNISYIETMIRVPNVQDSIGKLASSKKAEWNADTRPTKSKLNDLYQYFKENEISKWAKINADSLDSYYNKTNRHKVNLKFQTYGVRVSSNQPKIFGHLILAFETASLTENLVGINFVAPEDNYNALKNYKLHMQMFRFLSVKYPKTNISLHSGELVLGKGSVTEPDLKFHINDALKTANATRIGHGVDLVKEDNYKDILSFMKKNNCAVEINLESNEVILETSKNDHPIKEYLTNDIPICISTDDEGVLRTNLINQYLLLIEYVPEIKYSEIKKIVYNSIYYSFLNDTEKAKVLSELNNKFTDFEKEITTYNTVYK